MRHLRLIAIRPLLSVAAVGCLSLSPAFASDAETSASAGSNRGSRSGTAAATARYEGDVGFARTDTRSGSVNLARGVAVGVDKDGLSLSVSNAVATRAGLAIATNFNLEIERDGEVSFSSGGAISEGPIQRSASAGGAAGNNGGHSYATSTAAGNSDALGHSQASTHSQSFRPEPQRASRVVRVIRRR